MTLLFQDNFNGAAGSLQTHLPDVGLVGGVWNAQYNNVQAGATDFAIDGAGHLNYVPPGGGFGPFVRYGKNAVGNVNEDITEPYNLDCIVNFTRNLSVGYCNLTFSAIMLTGGSMDFTVGCDNTGGNLATPGGGFTSVPAISDVGVPQQLRLLITDQTASVYLNGSILLRLPIVNKFQFRLFRLNLADATVDQITIYDAPNEAFWTDFTNTYEVA